MSDDRYADQFRVLAKMREYAASDSETAEKRQAAQQGHLDLILATRGSPPPEIRAEWEEDVERTLADTRQRAQSAKEQLDIAAPAYAALDITKPEHAAS